MSVVKDYPVNIQEIKKIHFIHNYLDKGWKAYVQNSKGRKSDRMRRLILKNKEVSSQIILSEGVAHNTGYGIKNIDEEWVKENKKLVCVYNFIHNSLRKGWIIEKEKVEETKEKKISPFCGTYCFSKPHTNQVKYLSQSFLNKFVEENVNDDLIDCF